MLKKRRKKKIYIASDHGGFYFKEKIKDHFESIKSLNIELVDLGNSDFEPQDDYPIFADKLAKTIVKEKAIGILLCRSGVGVSIVANKTKGARAVLAFSPEIAKKAKESDDTNILCLGADYLSFRNAINIIHTWLLASPSKEKRHKRRLKLIEKIQGALGVDK